MIKNYIGNGLNMRTMPGQQYVPPVGKQNKTKLVGLRQFVFGGLMLTGAVGAGIAAIQTPNLKPPVCFKDGTCIQQSNGADLALKIIAASSAAGAAVSLSFAAHDVLKSKFPELDL